MVGRQLPFFSILVPFRLVCAMSGFRKTIETWPACLVVASTATGQHGHEGHILRYVFWHSPVLACLVGVLVVIQAYIVPAFIPR